MNKNNLLSCGVQNSEPAGNQSFTDLLFELRAAKVSIFVISLQPSPVGLPCWWNESTANANLGPNPIRFLNACAVVPVGCTLHPVVEHQSLGSSRSVGTYVPLP